jgi:hypothetical protein
MSQLRNLLTNKVVASKVGNVAKFRRHLRAHGRNLKSLRAELTERQEIARTEAEKNRAKASASKRPGLLRRVGNFLTRAFKGN